LKGDQSGGLKIGQNKWNKISYSDNNFMSSIDTSIQKVNQAQLNYSTKPQRLAVC